MSISVRTQVAFAGCSCVFIGVIGYFIYVYRIRRAASLRSRQIEEAAARFYVELLAQHERDRAARAAAEDEEQEEEFIELDQRIPFLVALPDSSLHVALLDEELSHLAPGAVNTALLPTRLGANESRGSNIPPASRSDGTTAGPVDLPTAFIAPPSSNVSPPSPPPQRATDAPDAPNPVEAADTAAPAEMVAVREPPPPPAAAPANPLPRSDSAVGERESMSQRLWRLGSAVFSANVAADILDNDFPPNVIWSTVSVPSSMLPASFLPAPERSSTLRGNLWRSNRSFQHLSGALGLTRAESAGSSRSVFGRSQTENENALYLPMHMHPEEDLTDEGSEEESAGIAADYPEGTFPESVSPRLHGISGRFQRADSARSMSRRGSASGRLASLSKTLSQALAMPGRDRRDRYAASTPSGRLAAAPVSAGTPPAASPEAVRGDAALSPHAVAVALPVM